MGRFCKNGSLNCVKAKFYGILPPSLGAKSKQFWKAERGVADSIAVPAPCLRLDTPRAPYDKQFSIAFFYINFGAGYHTKISLGGSGGVGGEAPPRFDCKIAEYHHKRTTQRSVARGAFGARARRGGGNSKRSQRSRRNARQTGK